MYFYVNFRDDDNTNKTLLTTLANEIEILLKTDQAYASRKIINMQKRDLPDFRIIQIMYNILDREVRRIKQFRKYDRL